MLMHKLEATVLPDSIAQCHKGTFMSQKIGSTRDRNLEQDIMTSATWHGP